MEGGKGRLQRGEEKSQTRLVRRAEAEVGHEEDINCGSRRCGFVGIIINISVENALEKERADTELTDRALPRTSRTLDSADPFFFFSVEGGEKQHMLFESQSKGLEKDWAWLPAVVLHWMDAVPSLWQRTQENQVQEG